MRGRRLLGAAATVLVALSGAVGLLLFFAARDTAPVDDDPNAVAGPGRAFPDQGSRHLGPGDPRPRYKSTPPTSGPHRPVPVRGDTASLSADQLLHALEAGNVVLAYGGASPPDDLTALARAASGGGFDPALARAGQAVILTRRAGTRGVLALAWRHQLRAASAADPALREFVEHWLGRGAPG